MSKELFCPICGTQNDGNAFACLECGCALNEKPLTPERSQKLTASSLCTESIPAKSYAVYLIFGICFGMFGLHNLYAGYRDKAKVNLGLVIVAVIGVGIAIGYLFNGNISGFNGTSIIAAIFLFIDSIMALSDIYTYTHDSDGRRFV